MASTARVCSIHCRLCRSVVSVRKALNLFKPKGMEQRWAVRIIALLEVPVDVDDGISPYICEKCKTHIAALERAVDDLESFKELARCSKSALDRTRATLKRTKETSSDVGVSPDTIRDRPSAKLQRKRLIFTCKYVHKTHLALTHCLF